MVHVCKHACARKIDVIKHFVQSSHVHTGHVHNSLQIPSCMSGPHMPNLDYVQIAIKPRKAEYTL